MTDWYDRFARLVSLGERTRSLTESVKRLARNVEDHQSRLVRLETIIEIARPDGSVLRIARDPSSTSA